MADIVEVLFKGGKREAFRNPMEFPFLVGDLAIVEVEKGEHIGHVFHIGLRDKNKGLDEVEHCVLRKAAHEDVKKMEQIHLHEREAMKICKNKVELHGLQMKLVDVEYQFDMKKLTFYFTSDGRVDFRELVKDLASHFRVRIDLRQIGARDETKRLGGLGVCGQQLCCTTFLQRFRPVTTQMARVQNLSLNPQKLSGCCGRLKCCLRYELDMYLQELKRFPYRESVYETERGAGVVEKIDIFSDRIYLRYENGDWEKVPLNEMAKLKCLHEGVAISIEFENGSGDDGEAADTVNDCLKKEDDSSPVNGGEDETDEEGIDQRERFDSDTPFPSEV